MASSVTRNNAESKVLSGALYVKQKMEVGGMFVGFGTFAVTAAKVGAVAACSTFSGGAGLGVGVVSAVGYGYSTTYDLAKGVESLEDELVHAIKSHKEETDNLKAQIRREKENFAACSKREKAEAKEEMEKLEKALRECKVEKDGYAEKLVEQKVTISRLKTECSRLQEKVKELREAERRRDLWLETIEACGERESACRKRHDQLASQLTYGELLYPQGVACN